MVKQDKDKTASRKKTVYELVGERRPPFRRGVDPLDDLLLDEEIELSREVKRVRLEEIVMRKRKELEKMKQGQDMDLGPMPSNADFLNMARFMSELSPEEAQRVRSAYTFFKLAEKGGGGGMTLLPMLLNYAKTNPGSSEGQLVNYLRLMDTQFTKGVELAKNMTPAKADASAMEFLKLMKDLVVEGVRNPVLQAIEKSRPSPGVFEQILTQPELWNRAKEIGMFGGGSNAAASQIDLEIEKLRGERQLSITKMELEMRRDELKRQDEDRRTDNLIAFMGPLAAAFAAPTAQRMKGLGQQQAATHNPTFTYPAPPAAAPPPSVNLRCSCGYEGTMPRTDPPRATIPCPSCGAPLRVSQPEQSSGEDQR